MKRNEELTDLPYFKLYFGKNTCKLSHQLNLKNVEFQHVKKHESNTANGLINDFQHATYLSLII
jgi:hypothetical protein